MTENKEQSKIVPKRRFKAFENEDGWVMHELGSVTDSFSGGTPAVGNSEFYSGDIPFIRSSEINSKST